MARPRIADGGGVEDKNSQPPPRIEPQYQDKSQRDFQLWETSMMMMMRWISKGLEKVSEHKSFSHKESTLF
jgi:hypothetical protein